MFGLEFACWLVYDVRKENPKPKVWLWLYAYHSCTFCSRHVILLSLVLYGGVMVMQSSSTAISPSRSRYDSEHVVDTHASLITKQCNFILAKWRRRSAA